MVRLRERQKFPNRTIEPKEVRIKRQAEEGAKALTDYKIARQQTLERMIALRQARLAQLSKEQA
jgi:hypothetical protein